MESKCALVRKTLFFETDQPLDVAGDMEESG